MMSRRKKSSTPKESTAQKEGPAADEGKLTIDEVLAEAGLKKSDRVLQVGCADGTVSLELARIAGYVTVVERSVELLAMAQERVLQHGTANLSIQQIEAGPLPFENATYDAAVSWGRVHREEDPAAMLREIVRVLKSPGRLLVADILGAESETRREAHAKIEQARSQLPTTLYTPSGLRALMSGDALEIVNQFQWVEQVDFDEWMPEQGTDVTLRERTARMIAGAARKHSTELDIEVAGKNITFKRRWMLIIAQKTGVT